MASGQYILDGKKPVPCSNILVWGRWLETANRHVASDRVGPLWVSTVFLGIDHNFGNEGPPLLFETMIFGEEASSEMTDSYCDRYATWEEAEYGHARAVEIAKERVERAKGLLQETTEGQEHGET